MVRPPLPPLTVSVRRYERALPGELIHLEIRTFNRFTPPFEAE